MVASSNSISSFLQWWAVGLTDVFPSPLSNLIFGSPAVHELSLRDDRAILELVYPGGRNEVFEMPIEADQKTGQKRVTRSRAVRQAAATETRETIVRLDQGKVLTTQIDLAANAALDLPAAVRADLDRFTPFSAESVYFDARIIGVDEAANRIKVKLQVAQIADVKEALSIARSAGLRPTCVTGKASQNGADMNILPAALRHRPGRLLPRLVKALALLLVCAVMVHAGLLYLRKQEVIDENQRLIRELRSNAVAAADKEDRLSDIRAAVGDLEAAKAAHPSAMVALAEITKALPQQSFLLDFELQDGVLRLSGFSSDPSELLVRLEQNDRLRNARFTAPLTRDPRTGLDRFSVEIEMVGVTP